MNKKKRRITKLKDIANNIRKEILAISLRAKVGHVGCAFSIVEILTVLYFFVLNVKPSQPDWKSRDRFILSKGHAVNALYPILAKRGFFPKQWLRGYCENGGHLGEHPEICSVPGIEHTTGSLGHGLSVAAGIALGAKMDRKSFRSFVLLSDGECDEGEIWEAALFAGHHRLDNLIGIMDYNKVQALGKTSEVLNLEPFADKWRAFGWHVEEAQGHDIKNLIRSFEKCFSVRNKPKIIIAHTIRGKGVSFMQHIIDWHYLAPNEKQYGLAMKELS